MLGIHSFGIYEKAFDASDTWQARLQKAKRLGFDFVEIDDKIIRKQGAPNNAHELTWKEMLNKKDFYLLWVMFIISSSVGLMLTSHIVNIAKYQAGWESGYLSVVVLAVFNTSGRLLGGSLSDRLGRITMIRIIFLIQLINMMFFGLLKSPITVTLGVSICGLCYGAGLAIFPAATADKFGIKNLGVNNGIMFAAWGIGGVVGPLVAGSLFDAFGVYNAAYYIAAMLLAAGLLFSLVYKKINVKTIAIEDNVDV